RLTDRGIRHLEERRRAHDRHVLGDVRHRQRQRRLGNLTVPQYEVPYLDRFEPGQLDTDHVRRGLEIPHRESTFRVRRAAALAVGADHFTGSGAPPRGPQRGSRAGVASPPRTDAEPLVNACGWPQALTAPYPTS